MKREAVKEQSRPRRNKLWWLGIGVCGAIALGVGAWLFLARDNHIGGEAQPKPVEPSEAGRFSAERPVTKTDLEPLEWEEVNQLLQAVGADAEKPTVCSRCRGALSMLG